MGEIPGAYAKAFDFSKLLDMEVNSDEEVEELCEGLAAVKLIRETKTPNQETMAQCADY